MTKPGRSSSKAEHFGATVAHGERMNDVGLRADS